MTADQWSATTPAPTSPVPPSATAGTATPVVTEDQKGLAAVAYILTWITGLIIFLVAKKEQRYVRWNAVQAIGLGIVLVVIGFALQILSMVGAMGGGLAMAGILGLLGLLFWIGTIVLIVLTAVKAYQGTPIRLPVLADFADKHA